MGENGYPPSLLMAASAHSPLRYPPQKDWPSTVLAISTQPIKQLAGSVRSHRTPLSVPLPPA